LLDLSISLLALIAVIIAVLAIGCARLGDYKFQVERSQLEAMQNE